MSASSHDETPEPEGAQNVQHAQHAQNVPPAMERAEVLVDQLRAQLGQWTSVLGDRLQRFWARAREEGEDIWAEAKDIRDRNQVGIPPTDRVERETHPKSGARRSRKSRSHASGTGAEPSDGNGAGS